jgi:ABC-2 type transport system ATP-binding protein
VAALASDVELLLLDEPTSGLDPLMEAVFRACIAEEHARGRTVLLSSHILAEVEALCDRVSIIRSGRTVESGTLAELRHLTRTAVSAELAAAPLGLSSIEGIHNLDIAGNRVRFSADPEALSRALRELTSAGVISLVSQPPTLEELFMRHYAGSQSGSRVPHAEVAQ